VNKESDSYLFEYGLDVTVTGVFVESHYKGSDKPGTLSRVSR